MNPLEVRVEDIFHVPGQGLVMAGSVLRGEVQLNDLVLIRSPTAEIKTRVKGIEVERDFVIKASEPQAVALVFDDITPGELEGGVQPLDGGGWLVVDLVVERAPPPWWVFWE